MDSQPVSPSPKNPSKPQVSDGQRWKTQNLWDYRKLPCLEKASSGNPACMFSPIPGRRRKHPKKKEVLHNTQGKIGI